MSLQNPTQRKHIGCDRYDLGSAIRRAYLKHGKDSWNCIADEVIAELSKPQFPLFPYEVKQSNG